jgi:small conductance mechanosensitive channel
MNSFLLAAADAVAPAEADALIGSEAMTESTFPLMEKGFEFLQIYGLPIIHAIIIYIIGVKVVRYATKYICHLMKKGKTDETLVRFASHLINATGVVFVIIGALTKLGMPTTSMVAVVGAAGLAIGLSLQGALSNFAAGILIIMFKPFKVGDLIDAGGTVGTVREIELFTSKLITPDNKTAVIPNSLLTADKIINFTETEDIRVDLTFGCSYGDDNDKVKSVLMNILTSDPRVLKEPAPMVSISGHGDSSINYAVRPWCKAVNYWDVYFAMHEKVKKEFDAQGISIPFPQRDLHIISGTEKIS